MLYDVRTYTARPGTLKKQLQLYHDHGFAPQSRNLGQPHAFLVTETGNINSYMHVWVYEDAADRAQKRAQLQADPEWLAYTRKVAEAGYIQNQETRLMTDAWFMT